MGLELLAEDFEAEGALDVGPRLAAHLRERAMHMSVSMPYT